ncbi:hypothetical protein KIH39_25515 [Telmatocola sphagniphila]|jgi:hypothetical protein|uniref:Thioredoxin domain-containing protein n=1 Tax=Telmatocola sphagniphila TaxID=1123043 RepID=A0A8E6EV23_9BACT|nr:hypothetical protein [Telmatocola sphagniphila]QVL32155.1 hypothetical protein KIH39_25515 [Telmatocola sphagniphila]
MKRVLFAAVAAVAVMFSYAAAAEIKSSIQVGEKIPGAFHPLNINGESAGQKACLVCKNGGNPVAMIFARDVDANLTKLIKKIDEATKKNSAKEMGSFVVFCSDKEGLEGKLKELAKTEKIETTVLAIDNPSGPKGYKVAPDAAVTVVLYNDRKVEANFAFGKDELNDTSIEKVLSAIPTILK